MAGAATTFKGLLRYLARWHIMVSATHTLSGSTTLQEETLEPHSGSWYACPGRAIHRDARTAKNIDNEFQLKFFRFLP